MVTIGEGRECAPARRGALDGSPSRRARDRADARGADVAAATGSPLSVVRESTLRLRAASRRERRWVARVARWRGRARRPVAGEVFTWVCVAWAGGVLDASCVVGVASCAPGREDAAAGDAVAELAAAGAEVAAGEACAVALSPLARESDDLPDAERRVLTRVVAPAAPGVALCVVAGLPPSLWFCGPSSTTRSASLRSGVHGFRPRAGGGRSVVARSERVPGSRMARRQPLGFCRPGAARRRFVALREVPVRVRSLRGSATGVLLSAGDLGGRGDPVGARRR